MVNEIVQDSKFFFFFFFRFISKVNVVETSEATFLSMTQHLRSVLNLHKQPNNQQLHRRLQQPNNQQLHKLPQQQNNRQLHKRPHQHYPRQRHLWVNNFLFCSRLVDFEQGVKQSVDVDVFICFNVLGNFKDLFTCWFSLSVLRNNAQLKRAYKELRISSWARI